MELFALVRTTLTDAETKALRDWFEKGECEKLREIARSKARENASAATNAAMDSAPTNSYGDAAGAKLRAAQRYQTFLSVLEEIIATKTNFEIVNVK